MREKTVLIIDDEVRIAESLRDLLTVEHYKVCLASSGRQALDILAKLSFHVIVTDLRMPDIGGLDVIKYVHENFPKTLIIVITGHATTDSAIQAVHYHVFDYLRKPFEFDHFRLAIEKAFQKLEFEQLRETMAAMITHDIKVPLTSIIGFASMIADPDTGEIHPKACEFADTITANGQKILELIENFLTGSKIESGSLEITPMRVDPKGVIEDVVHMARIEAERHGHQIEVSMGDLPEIIEVDEVLIYRALNNLSQNAMKYSLDDTPIRIEAGIVQPGDSPLGIETFFVHVMNQVDTILPGQFDDIFDRYKRGESSGGIQGTGLGLFVVDAVARAHQGLAKLTIPDLHTVQFSLYLPSHQNRQPENQSR